MVNSAIEVSISFSFYIYMSFPPLPTGISGDKINVVIYMTLIFHWGILKYSATDLIFEKAFTIFSAVFPAQSTNVWKSSLVACCPSAEGLSSALDKIFFRISFCFSFRFSSFSTHFLASFHSPLLVFLEP